MSRMLGDAFVSVRPESEGFRAQTEAALKKATRGLQVNIGMNLNAKHAQEQARAAADKISAEIQRLNRERIRLNVDSQGGLRTVDHLRAKLEQVAHDVFSAKISVDDTKAQAKASELVAKINAMSRRLEQWKIGANTDKATAEILKLRDEAHRLLHRLDIPVRLEDKAVQEKIRALQERVARLSHESANIHLGANDKEANAKLAELQAKLLRFAKEVAKARTDVDIANAHAKLSRIDADLSKFAHQHSTATAGVNTKGGQSRLALMRAELDKFSHKRADATVGVNSHPLMRVLSGLGGVFRAAFGKAKRDSAGAADDTGASLGQRLIHSTAGKAFQQAPLISAGVIAGLAALPAAIGLAGVGIGVSLGVGVIAGAIKLITAQEKALTTQINKLQAKVKAGTATAADKRTLQADQQQLEMLHRMAQSYDPIIHQVSRLKVSFLQFASVTTKPLIKPISDALKGLNQQLTGPLEHNFKNLFAAVAPYIGPIVRGMTTFVNAVLPGLTSMLNSARGPLTGLIGNLAKVTGSKLGQWFKDAAPHIRNSGKYLIGLLNIAGQLGGVLIKFGGAVAKAFNQLGPSAVAAFKALGPAIVSMAKGLGGLSGAGLSLTADLLKLVSHMSPGEVQALAVGYIALAGAFKAMSVITSISTALKDFKATVIGAAVANGIAAAATWVWTAAQTALDVATGAFAAILDSIGIGELLLLIGLIILGIIALIKYHKQVFHAVAVAWDAIRHAIAVAVIEIVHWFAHVWGWLLTIGRAFMAFGRGIPHVFDIVRHAVASFGHDIAHAFDVVRHAIASAWNAAAHITSVVWHTILSVLKASWNWIKGAGVSVWHFIYNSVHAAWNAIARVTGSVWHTVMSILKGSWNWIKGAGVAVWHFIYNSVHAAWNAIAHVTSSVWHAVMSILKASWNWIKGAGVSVWHFIYNSVHAAWNAIAHVTSTVWHVVMSILKVSWNWIKGAGVSVWHFVYNSVHAAWNAIAHVTSAVWHEVMSILKATWNWIKGAAVAVWHFIYNTIRNFWSGVKSVTGAVWNAILGFLKASWNWIKNAAVAVWHFVYNTIHNFWAGVKSVTGAVWNAILGFLKASWNWIKNAAVAVWHFVYNTIHNFWAGVKAVTGAVWNAIRGFLSATWNWIKNAAVAVWHFVYNTIHNFWAAVKNVTGAVWNAIKGFLSATWNWIKSAAVAVWHFVYNTIHNFWAAVKNVTSAVWNAIKGFLKDTWNWIKGAAVAIWHFIYNTIHNFWENVKNITGQVWDAIKGFLERIWNGLKNTVVSIWHHIYGTVNSIWNTIKHVSQVIWNDTAGFLERKWNEMVNTASKIWGRLSGIFSHVFATVKGDILGGINDAIDLINGLIKAYDFVGKFLHLPHIPTIPHVGGSGGWKPSKNIQGGATHAKGTGHATGGPIPGYAPGSDTVPAMLSPGEYVINPTAAKAFGHRNLEAINSMARPGAGQTTIKNSTQHFVNGGDILSYAEKFKGHPYLWGGAPKNNQWDCSSFASKVLEDRGIRPPGGWDYHSGGHGPVAGQFRMGHKVPWGKEAAGDIAVEKNGGHVTFVVGGNNTTARAFGAIGHAEGTNFQTIDSGSFDLFRVAGVGPLMGGVGVPLDPKMVAAYHKAMKIFAHTEFKGKGAFSEPPKGDVNNTKGGFQKVVNNAYQAAVAAAAAAASAGSLGGGPAGGATGSARANGLELYRYLLKNLFGGSKNATIAATGSIYGESTYNPFSQGTGGRGLIGWTPPSSISDAAFKGGMKTQLPEIINFVRKNHDEGAINAMKSAGSVGQAQLIWFHQVERGGINDWHPAGAALANSFSKMATGGPVRETPGRGVYGSKAWRARGGAVRGALAGTPEQLRHDRDAKAYHRYIAMARQAKKQHKTSMFLDDMRRAKAAAADLKASNVLLKDPVGRAAYELAAAEPKTWKALAGQMRYHSTHPGSVHGRHGGLSTTDMRALGLGINPSALDALYRGPGAYPDLMSAIKGGINSTGKLPGSNTALTLKMLGKLTGQHGQYAGKRFAQGGWINEPVSGIGMNSGMPYSFGEGNRRERVLTDSQAQNSTAPMTSAQAERLIRTMERSNQISNDIAQSNRDTAKAVGGTGARVRRAW